MRKLMVLLGIATISVSQSALSQDVCVDFGQPVEMGFQYLPGTDVITNQDQAKIIADIGVDDDGISHVIATDEISAADVLSGSGERYFAGDVPFEGLFVANEDTDLFGAVLYIHFFDDSFGGLLQTIEYHTSCSQPIHLGDVIGNATLVSYVGELGPVSGVLLIPDFSKVWAFDPFDGSLLTDSFIPADGNMLVPINAVDSGAGTILVSDSVAGAVFEYAYDGSFLRAVITGLGSLEGMVVQDGEILVTSGIAPLIHRVSLAGTLLETWSDAPELGTPRDLVFRAADVLITDSSGNSGGGENIERFGQDGQFIETFHDSNGVTGIDSPRQIQVLDDGRVLVAGFNSPIGLYVYDAGGNEVSAFTNLVNQPRGVYPLGNSQILYAGGPHVVRYDPVTMTEETIVNESGANFAYIEFSPAPFAVDTDGDAVPDSEDNCIQVANADQRDTNGDGFGNVCDADLNNDCMINFGDLSIMKAMFFGSDPDSDLDGDGGVNFADLSIMKAAFFGVPGPSGLPNACPPASAEG